MDNKIPLYKTNIDNENKIYKAGIDSKYQLYLKRKIDYKNELY